MLMVKHTQLKPFKTTINTKKYTIKLTYKNGKPIKNAKVTLTVKGKTYKATTDKNGKATFKTGDATFTATATLSAREKHLLLCGGLLASLK